MQMNWSDLIPPFDIYPCVVFHQTFIKDEYIIRVSYFLSSSEFVSVSSFALCHSGFDQESIQIIIDIDSRFRGNDIEVISLNCEIRVQVTVHTSNIKLSF